MNKVEAIRRAQMHLHRAQVLARGKQPPEDALLGIAANIGDEVAWIDVYRRDHGIMFEDIGTTEDAINDLRQLAADFPSGPATP